MGNVGQKKEEEKKKKVESQTPLPSGRADVKEVGRGGGGAAHGQTGWAASRSLQSFQEYPSGSRLMVCISANGDAWRRGTGQPGGGGRIFFSSANPSGNKNRRNVNILWSWQRSFDKTLRRPAILATLRVRGVRKVRVRERRWTTGMTARKWLGSRPPVDLSLHDHRKRNHSKAGPRAITFVPFVMSSGGPDSFHGSRCDKEKKKKKNGAIDS